MSVKIKKTPVTDVVDNNRRMEFDITNEEVIGSEIPVDMLFLGDSITNNWEAQLWFHKYGTVINRGIGGDRIECIDQRLEGDALQIGERVLVLMIGINNTWNIEDAESPENEAENRRKFILEHYESILKQCKAAGQHTLVCSVLPVCDCDLRKRLIIRLNEGIKALCEKYGFEYVDYHSAVAESDGITMPRGLTADGLHPNSDGYRIMCRVLSRSLDKIFN